MLFRHLVLLACSAGAVLAGPIQKSNLRLPRDAAAHKKAVENIFLESWAAYKYVISSRRDDGDSLTDDAIWTGNSRTDTTI